MEFGDDDDTRDSPGVSPSPENSPESMSLAERLSKKVKTEPGAKEAKETKGKKQLTLPFKPMKKEPQKQMDSDSEFELEEVIPRVVQPRRAAAQVKYVLDSDEEEDAGGSNKDSDVDSDVFDPSGESDDEESFVVSKPARKSKASSK
ncbi:unnamed protein product, partial [Staurois parvus]